MQNIMYRIEKLETENTMGGSNTAPMFCTTKRNKRQIKCYNCQQRGHIAKDCSIDEKRGNYVGRLTSVETRPLQRVNVTKYGPEINDQQPHKRMKKKRRRSQSHKISMKHNASQKSDREMLHEHVPKSFSPERSRSGYNIAQSNEDFIMLKGIRLKEDLPLIPKL